MACLTETGGRDALVTSLPGYRAPATDVITSVFDVYSDVDHTEEALRQRLIQVRVGTCTFIAMLVRVERKALRNVSFCRPSACFFSNVNRERSAAHNQRDSPGGSTRRGQRTFPSEYQEDRQWHTCFTIFASLKPSALYPHVHYLLFIILSFYAFAIRQCHKGIMFSGCPSPAFVRSSVHLDRSCYHNISYERLEQSRWNLHSEYLLTPTDDPIRLWEVKGQTSRSRQAVQVAKAFTSTLVEVYLLVYKCYNFFIILLLFCYLIILYPVICARRQSWLALVFNVSRPNSLWCPYQRASHE